MVAEYCSGNSPLNGSSKFDLPSYKTDVGETMSDCSESRRPGGSGSWMLGS